MSTATKKRSAWRPATPYQFALPPCNPESREPWTIGEENLRRLINHCISAAEFAQNNSALPQFVCRADTGLKQYEYTRQMSLRGSYDLYDAIYKHSIELWKALSTLGRSVDGMRQLHRASGLAVLPTADQIKGLADGARAQRALMKWLSGKGKRDETRILALQELIAWLWQMYPTSLRSIGLRSHFLESLRLILGRAATEHRALQAQVRRALLAEKERDELGALIELPPQLSKGKRKAGAKKGKNI